MKKIIIVLAMGLLVAGCHKSANQGTVSGASMGTNTGATTNQSAPVMSTPSTTNTTNTGTQTTP